MKNGLCSTAILFLCLNIIACARNISPDSYAVGSVGQVNRAVKGTIVSARQVDITGSQSGLGATVGAAGGGVAGSAIGGGVRGNVLGAIGGAVVGGVIGNAVEEGASKQQGMEYVVETENGSLITVVQGLDPELSIGGKVIVLYGTRVRIISAPK